MRLTYLPLEHLWMALLLVGCSLAWGLENELRAYVDTSNEPEVGATGVFHLNLRIWMARSMDSAFIGQSPHLAQTNVACFI